MNIKKIIYLAAVVAAFTFSLTGCNTSDSSYSPQEIIDQAMQETVAATTYYGEYEMDFGGAEDNATVMEWVKEGKRRIDMIGMYDEHFITVNDGRTVTTYDTVENSAIIYEMNKDALTSNTSPSPREQAQLLLDMVQDTHNISIASEEKIAGRDSYHIVAKAEKANGFIGDMELWIDKKTWITLKTITTSADVTMITEYTKIDFDANIDDAQFELELPADATIETIDDEDYSLNPSTIEEAKAVFGSFLQFNEDAIKLLSVTNVNVAERPEFSFEYVMDDVPALTLTLVKRDTSQVEISTAELSEQEIMVRGIKGLKMDMGSFRFIQWEEEGLQYGVIINNPDITFDEVVSHIEQMELN
ncbi:LolA family protein [Solibacillus sp. FSL H8-0538]|uniref:LolA family protein n=1 Tax=Solibacillus sp. FSL H8-0538 TaxID=2921400 RepID=UPI0030F9CDD2